MPSQNHVDLNLNYTEGFLYYLSLAVQRNFEAVQS
jgi:hypothetical protein